MATKKVNIDIIAKDKSKQALKNVQGNLDKVKSSAGKLKGALAAVGGALVVRNILATTSEFQDLRTSLSSVTGSAEKGAEAFEFVSKFATKTQFSIQDLSRSFIKLKAAGIEPSKELLNIFTNTAAITTDQVGSLEAVTDLFARTVSGGLGLEEIQRLGDRGVPILRILEEQLGLTRGQISEFGKSADGAKKIVDAFGKGIQEQFGGATEALLDNLSVSFSNFGIAVDNLKDAFGSEVSEQVARFTNNFSATIEFIEPLISLLGKLTSLLLQGVNIAFEAVGKSVSFVVNKFDQFLRFIGIVDEEVAKNVESLDKLAEAAKNAGEKLEEISVKENEIFDIFKETQKTIDANGKLIDTLSEQYKTELELLKDKQKKELDLVEQHRADLTAFAMFKIDQGSDREYEMRILEKHLKNLNILEKRIKLEVIKELRRRPQMKNKE